MEAEGRAQHGGWGRAGRESRRTPPHGRGRAARSPPRAPPASRAQLRAILQRLAARTTRGPAKRADDAAAPRGTCAFAAKLVERLGERSQLDHAKPPPPRRTRGVGTAEQRLTRRGSSPTAPQPGGKSAFAARRRTRARRPASRSGEPVRPPARRGCPRLTRDVHVRRPNVRSPGRPGGRRTPPRWEEIGQVRR